MSVEQWALSRRLDFIRQLQETGKPIGTQEVHFQGEVRFYDVYIVDIGFPCYRLANGRTQAAQREVIAREGLDEDFFVADPDSAAALDKQEEILRGMVTSGTDAKIVEILSRSPQTQPLILDSEGYVINGNRRLCAMRSLYEQDAKEFERFKHVQVLFLPPCTQNDVDELEARLQWMPDGRSDYSWVDKAIVLRQRQDRGWTVEKMASFYEMTKSEVQLWIAMLDDAEAYLDERGWTGEYSRVLDMRYAFEQLQKGRRKCGTDEPKKQLFTTVSYLMLDDADAAGRRLYESIPDALKFLDDIVGQIRTDIDSAGGSEVGDDTSGDDLSVLGPDPDSEYERVAALIRNTERGDEVRDIVRDKIEEKRRDERERRDATYCLRETRKAYTALQNVRSNMDDTAETDGMGLLLDNIESVSQEIRGTLGHGED